MVYCFVCIYVSFYPSRAFNWNNDILFLLNELMAYLKSKMTVTKAPTNISDPLKLHLNSAFVDFCFVFILFFLVYDYNGITLRTFFFV